MIGGVGTVVPVGFMAASCTRRSSGPNHQAASGRVRTARAKGSRRGLAVRISVTVAAWPPPPDGDLSEGLAEQVEAPNRLHGRRSTQSEPLGRPEVRTPGGRGRQGNGPGR